MGIIVDASGLLDAVTDITGQGRGEGLDALASAMVAAMSALADAVAEAEGVQHSGTENEPGFGGLCATFCLRAEGDDGSDILAAYDEGGEW